jgi:two-component system OmpR family response regulator
MSERGAPNPVEILVVDDDPDICDYMQTMLSQAGYIVQTLTNPSRAIEELRAGRYHIVVLDLMMPKVDGIEVLKAMRKIDSDVAIVILTGYPSVETAVESLKLDVSDYIKKPFDADDFLNAIERICRKKGLLTDSEELLHATIGRSIRRLRKDQDLTLKQMSRRTGLSVSLLSQIERAESSASVSSLHKVARALTCRLTELFGEF